MKNVVIATIMALLLWGMTAQAQSWKSLHDNGDASYLGGFYAAVSYACLKTNYTDDSGVWASGPATIHYEKGCAKSIWDAMFGDVATPYGS